MLAKPQPKKRYGTRRIFLFEYELNPKDFEKTTFKEEKGGYGEITFLKYKKTKEIYARKSSIRPFDKNEKQYLYQEVNILINVRHPTIVPFKGYSIDEGIIYIYTQYMPNGSLDNLIQKGINNLDPTKKQIILVGIARGMMILHKQCIIHRDLKPKNVLLDKKFRPKICDFGLSKFFNPNDPKQANSFVGTLAYMAPEVLNRKKYDYKADVYSFGLLMYEVVSIDGSRAYSEEKGLSPDYSKVKKKSLRRMIKYCLNEDPEKRPTFAEIYNKLSLSKEEFFFVAGNGISQPTINKDDDSDNEDDNEKSGDDNDIDSNDKYCLDGINLVEFQSYIDEIDIENEIRDKKEEIDDSKAKNKQNEDRIKESEKNIESLNIINNKLKEKNDNNIKRIDKSEIEQKELQKKYEKMSEETKKMKDEISRLFELAKNLANEQDQIANSMQQMNIHHVSSPKAPNYENTSPRNYSKSGKQSPQQQKPLVIRNDSTKPKSIELLPNLKKDHSINNKTMNTVEIPPGNDTIALASFKDCIDIQSIQIPSTIKFIENYSFCGCTSLIDIKLPPLLESINAHVFDGCSSLTHIEIPPDLKTIGIAAFMNCTSLKTIKIPESVVSIGESAFCNCKSLESIDVPIKVTIIKFNTFCGCESLKKVSLPENLIEIENAAFMNCKSLTSIEIPRLIASIDSTVFKGCEKLLNVKVPAKIILKNVFQENVIIKRY